MSKTDTSSRIRSNVTWIFIGNFSHALIKFLLNIYVVRQISVESNGMINYLLSLVLLFSGITSLGFGATFTKEIVDHEDKYPETMFTCVASRAMVSSLVIIGLQIYACFSSQIYGDMKIILFVLSLQLLFDTPNLIVNWLLYKNKAKNSEIYRLVAFFISVCISFLAIYKFNNFIIYSIGIVAESFFYAVLLVWFYKKNYIVKLKFDKKIAKYMVTVSAPFMISYLLTSLYAQIDKIMLQNMLSTSSVAVYSVAQVLAGALSMIPGVLVSGFRPDIMEYKLKNRELYERRFKQVYCIIFWLSTAFCIFVTLFSKQMILIIYGEKYLDAVQPLSLIVWYSAFSYFGSVNNLYIVAEKKNKYAQFITLGAAISNVALNYFLIPIWGVNGAAIATIFAQFFANVLLPLLIPDLREIIKFMLAGIFFKIKGESK